MARQQRPDASLGCLVPGRKVALAATITEQGSVMNFAASLARWPLFEHATESGIWYLKSLVIDETVMNENVYAEECCGFFIMQRDHLRATHSIFILHESCLNFMVIRCAASSQKFLQQFISEVIALKDSRYIVNCDRSAGGAAIGMHSRECTNCSNGFNVFNASGRQKLKVVLRKFLSAANK